MSHSGAVECSTVMYLQKYCDSWQWRRDQYDGLVERCDPGR